jgi:hypothetical protein
MNTFKSKVGYELAVPVLSLLIGLFFFMVFMKILPGAIIILLCTSFILHLFTSTYYQINGNQLIVKSSFVVNLNIDIASIKKITKTNSALSSPAMSMDRIEITYGKYDSVIISPKNKMEFIQEITSINPNIIIELKK